MNTERVIALIQPLEAWRDYVYDDRSPWPRSEVSRLDCRYVAGQYKVNATGGTATIGWGETSSDFIDLYWGKRITKAEAMPKMAERVEGFYRGVRDCIDADLTDHQWEAITCRAYQTGAGGFCRSDTAEALRAGWIDTALDSWRTEFAHPDRSEVEIAHFLTPDEEAPMPPRRVYTRDEWGASPPRGATAAPSQNLGLAFHHLGDGWGPTDGPAESIAKMQWVQEFHMGPQRGWADFAYNWAIDHLGNIFVGRGENVRNAANGGGIRNGWDANARWSSALYLAGSSGPELTPAARDAAWFLMEHLGLVHAEWLGHDDFLSTECPGPDRRRWLDDGHPRGNAAPTPVPEPEPDLEVASMFIFDGPPERGGGVYYTDGRTKWGVPNEASLVFYATGVVPHLGVLKAEVFDALPWNTVGLSSNSERSMAIAMDQQAQPDVAISGSLVEAMDRSEFETGDPGCAG